MSDSSAWCESTRHTVVGRQLAREAIDGIAESRGAIVRLDVQQLSRSLLLCPVQVGAAERQPLGHESMPGSNTRSNLLGAVGVALPFVAAGLGVASIAGVTGCHLEVLVIPFALLAAGAIAAVVTGGLAIRLRRSKRGLVMPAVAIVTGIGALIWLVTISGLAA